MLQFFNTMPGASPEMSGSTTCPPVAGLVSPDGHCESLQVPAELCQTDSGSIKIQHFIETGRAFSWVGSCLVLEGSYHLLSS